jgi:hypothetical protein
MMTNADALDMQCPEDSHVSGCPCYAGGDPIYLTYPPCFICKRDTDSTSVRVDYGARVETVCDTCWSKRDEDYLDERLDMTDAG